MRKIPPITASGLTFSIPTVTGKHLDIYKERGTDRHRATFHVTKLLERMYGRKVDFRRIVFDVKMRPRRHEVIVRFRLISQQEKNRKDKAKPDTKPY